MHIEVGCYIFLIYLVYWYFSDLNFSSLSLDIPGILFLMSLLLSEKPGITNTNVLYLVFRTRKLSSTTNYFSCLLVPMINHSSLKFFCFEPFTIFEICYGICQSVNEEISDTANMKKILETSYRKMLNLF